MKKVKAVKLLLAVSEPIVALRFATRLLAGAALAAQVWIIGIVANCVVESRSIWLPLLAYLVCVGLAGLDNELTVLYEHIQAHRVNKRLKQALLKMQTECYVEDLEELHSSGQLLVAQDALRASGQLLYQIMDIVERAIYLAGLVLIAAQLGVQWVLLIGLCIVPAYFFNISGVQGIYRVFKQTSAAQNYGEYLFNLLFGVKYLKEIRWLQLETELMTRRDRVLADSDSKMIGAARTEMLKAVLSYALAVVGVVAVAWQVSSLVIAGRLAAGTGLSIFMASANLIASGAGLMRMLTKAIMGMVKTGDLARTISLPAVERPTKRGKLSGSPADARYVVSLNNVTFTYKSGERPALNNITCRIPRNSLVVLVGENGSGKSTLIRVILGLLKPQAGQVECLSSPSVVLQKPPRYQFSVGENVFLGDVKSEYNPARIGGAMEKAGLNAESLGGLEQNLGTIRESGRDLSTGQWQRLALARAWYHDGELMILDEPTAYMDPESEIEFYQVLRNQCRGKSVIVATHRIGVARTADWVLVLKNGLLVEQGTHEQLMAAQGHYYELYQAQAHWYNWKAGEQRA